MTGPEVCVVGGGPSGVALATELAALGRSVEVVDPDPTRPWIPGYGTWDDDLDILLMPELAAVVRSATAHRWDTARVETDTGGQHRIERPYLRLHTPRLHEALWERAIRAGVRAVEGRVSAVGTVEGGRQPVLTSRGTRWARLVVDATGRGLPEVRRPTRAAPGVQVAYGQTLTVAHHPWPVGEMVLMDWRRIRGGDPRCGDGERHPTFLYALPFSDTEVFVEETVLSSRPARPMSECIARLPHRLAQLDVPVVEVLDEERCRIPMGGPGPGPLPTDRAVLPFGAAAGLVHPATGYSLVQSLRLAPAVARAVHDALEVGDGIGAAHAGWQTVWPLEARRTRALFTYGLELLLQLPLHAMQTFYDAFFAAETHCTEEERLWPGYMADALPPAQVARLMGRVFLAADLPTRVRLARGGTGSDHVALARALVGM